MTVRELVDQLNKMRDEGRVADDALVEVVYKQDSNEGVTYYGTPTEETIVLMDDDTRLVILGS